jgi:23S rRNA (uracil1939-C5)-methyltransferase
MKETGLFNNIGDKIELAINDLSSDGYGVGRINNIAVFVDGALPGEVIKAGIAGVKKKYLTAKLISIIIPSANRQEPFCPVFEECGGCTLQHMSYDCQLDYKKKKVKDAIERISGLKNVQINNVIGTKQDRGYRNKVQFFFDYNNGEVNCGFFGRKSHIVINNDICFLISDTANKLKNEFVDFIKKNRSEFYDAKNNAAILKSIIIRQAFRTNELMLIIVISRKIDKKLMNLFLTLTDNLTSKIPGLKSVYYSVNASPDKFMINDKIRHLKGSKSITEIICGLRFNISPGSFFQVNPFQAEKLYSKIIELADLKINETVLDLFCGTGIISLFLASKGAKVFGIDIVKSAIEDANENTKINNIISAKFIQGDVFKLLEARVSHKSSWNEVKIDNIDVLVVDPPRDGLAEKLINLISKFNAKKVIYVSCNAATLARDLKAFDDLGYKAKAIHPIDMFPHTEHVESVVLLTNVTSK